MSQQSPQSESLETEDISSSPEVQESTEPVTENTDASQEQPPASEGDDWKAALEQAENNAKAAQDKYLRLHAEFDNYRRRTAREQLELIETANGKLLEQLSEVQDNFERAFAEENKTGNMEAFEKGMQLIHDQFRRVLAEFGLEQIDPIGQEFDPNHHEAFLKQPSEQIPEGHVIQVFQKGYKIKNKLLKTAKVVVSAGKN